jgi:L-amino acid N-acyltransferase YncA
MISPAFVIDVTIRACEDADIASVTSIYAHHVLHGLASFEAEPPSETEMRNAVVQ